MRLLCLLLVCFLFACQKTPTDFEIKVKEMTDAEYPDNPNLEFRHSKAEQRYFGKIVLHNQGNNLFDFSLISHKPGECEIKLRNVPVLEMMPTAPKWIQKDKYLTYIGVINQEWNRQQVQFKVGQFEVSGTHGLHITRVDLARNCLNAYLWEMLVYAEDSDGKEKLFWQCWFDFPASAYKDLFELRNNLDYEDFRKGLENWIDPESKLIDLALLRSVISEVKIGFENKSQEMYPLKGERERKRKNIIAPRQVNSIQDLLSDSTQFATFSIPGYYNRKDPRKTELSKLGILKKVIKREIADALGEKSIELELIFETNTGSKSITKFIIGGLNTEEFPILEVNEANNGWQTSMGISNHSFHETFDYQKNHPTQRNSFYAFLLDSENRWIDSHKVGIDGPLFHFDKKNPSKLHFWILSFERHAFVGHYQFDI